MQAIIPIGVVIQQDDALKKGTPVASSVRLLVKIVCSALLSVLVTFLILWFFDLQGFK